MEGGFILAARPGYCYTAVLIFGQGWITALLSRDNLVFFEHLRDLVLRWSCSLGKGRMLLQGGLVFILSFGKSQATVGHTTFLLRAYFCSMRGGYCHTAIPAEATIARWR